MNEITLAEIKALTEEADEVQLEALERSLASDTRKGVATAFKRAHARLDAQRAERERLDCIYAFQANLAREAGACCVVGIDEVGRGPLAGPLAVGAVVLPNEPKILGLNDSKQVKDADRQAIAKAIKGTAIAHAVEFVDPSVIDDIGIMAALRSAFVAVVASIEAQGQPVDMILLDGNPMRFDVRETNVIKGDSKCASIAAASILAKVERDRLMNELDVKYPGYGFSNNKGYGTKAHIDAIRELGLSDIHRRSYCSEFLQESLF